MRIFDGGIGDEPLYVPAGQIGDVVAERAAFGAEPRREMVRLLETLLNVRLDRWRPADVDAGRPVAECLCWMVDT